MISRRIIVRTTIIALGVVAGILLVAIGGPVGLWQRLTTKRIWFEIAVDGHLRRGYVTWKRFSESPERHGKTVSYFVETGFMSRLFKPRPRRK